MRNETVDTRTSDTVSRRRFGITSRRPAAAATAATAVATSTAGTSVVATAATAVGSGGGGGGTSATTRWKTRFLKCLKTRG